MIRCHPVALFATAALLWPIAPATAQIAFDEDATLRGIRTMGIAIAIKIKSQPQIAIDTQAVRESLEQAVELELRRTGITVRDAPFSTSKKQCGPDFGIVWLEVIIMDHGPDVLLSSYQLYFKQRATLSSGYSDFLTPWWTGE